MIQASVLPTMLLMPSMYAFSKARGIESLGALLDRSETMLVLMDERYPTRLWCLFEVAAFAKRAGLARMRFVPTHGPLIDAGVAAALFVNITLTNLLVLGATHLGGARSADDALASVMALGLPAMLASNAPLLGALLLAQRSLAAVAPPRPRAFACAAATTSLP